jgi:serine/threonine protein kinase
LDAKSNTINSFEKIKKIGSGGFGDVYCCKRKSNNFICCLKFINIMPDGIESSLNLKSEINILKQMNHPNIVHYIDYFLHEDDIVLVMEFIEGQSLREIINIQRSKKELFSKEFICLVFSQLISALFYCQTLKIIHRDLKPENILITNDNRIKLIDFGLSKQMETISKIMNNQVGTYAYMSPEMINEEGYSSNTDIWSLGCIIYELMYLKHPFSYNLPEYVKFILQQITPQFDNIFYSKDLIKFIL